jgi:hypothetical protein
LLIWGKDRYTERFLVLLPCICVLQPTLVHFYQTSLLLPESFAKETPFGDELCPSKIHILKL